MRLAGFPLLGAALVMAGGMSPARAETAAAPLYVVAYFEVMPSAAARATGLLHGLAAASRKEDGNQGFDALADIDRPGRFAIVAAWRDQKALDAHMAPEEAFRGKLLAMLTGPYDARPSVGLSVAAPAGQAAAAGAVYVLTHVDVVPAQKDQTVALVKQLAEDSRKEKGNLAFDVLQQGNRPNHMTLWEGWASRGAFDAHVTAAATRDFRQKLGPLQGALYDERLYRLLR